MIRAIVRELAVKTVTLASSVGVLFVSHSTLSAQIHVKLPEIVALAGSKVSIPVMLGDLKGEEVTAFEFEVSGDTSIVRFAGVEQGGTLSEGLTMFANNRVRPYNAGHMKVVCASAEPIRGKGVLVRIIATVGRKAGSCPVVLTNVVLNAGKPETLITNGIIRSKLQTIGSPKVRGSSLLYIR